MKLFLIVAVLATITLTIKSDQELSVVGHDHPCNSTVRCNSKKDLQCLDGFCKCGDQEYDLQTEGCLPSPSANNGFACHSDTQCKFHSSYGVNTICDPDSKKCVCDDTQELVFVEVNHTCVLPKAFEEPCNEDNECKYYTKGDAICEKAENSDEGVCKCAKHSVYDASAKECIGVLRNPKSAGATGNLPMVAISLISLAMVFAFNLF